jgi:hypothetical protein
MSQATVLETDRLETELRNLETRLSQENRELLRRIRQVRADIGPVSGNTSEMLRELDAQECLPHDA